MSFATISVIGLGYIGLPTAAAFASRQKQVIGVDINQHAVDPMPHHPKRDSRHRELTLL